MGSDIQGSQKIYTTKEIATLLDMAISTVRKYAQQLEKSGYTIKKTASKARTFTDNDIMVMRYLKDLRDKTNITVEQAASVVIERFRTNDEVSVITSNSSADSAHEMRYEEMELKLNIQAEQIKILSARLEELEKQSDKRYNILLKNMKKLVGAIRGLVKENKREKSWFTRFLGR